MTPKPKRGGAGRNQGRKAVDKDGFITEPMTRVIRFRATDSEYDKWHRLGGSAWNRKAINRAKEPEQEK